MTNLHHNRRWSDAAAAVCVLLFACAFAHAFVYETETEIHAQGDFDGNTKPDQVIVDRATGFYRLGYQAPSGNHVWMPTRAGGVEDVEGISVGRVLDTGRDALAVTGAGANRINLLDASSQSTASNPVPVFLPPVIGPNLVVASDIGGAGNTAHHDLFVGTRYNNYPTHLHQTLVRSSGTVFNVIMDTALPGKPTLGFPALTQGNRVVMQDGGTEMVALVRQHGITNTLQVFDLQTGAAVEEAAVAGLVNGTRYTHGRFSEIIAPPLHHYLFYVAGLSNFVARAVTEPAPGDFDFDSPATNNLPGAVGQIVVLDGTPRDKLLVLFEDGTGAAVYDFNGAAPPALVQGFTSPTGTHFTGAAVLTGHSFMLYSGEAGSGISTQVQPHAFNGTNYVAGAPTALPSLTAYSAPANVFLFSEEPFVEPVPHLVASLQTPDWTSDPSLAGSVVVTAETFVSSNQGMDDPVARSLGSVPAPAKHGLANQYIEPISMYSFAPAIGLEGSDVSIAPPPGLYPTSIEVSFTTVLPGDTVRYRLAPKSNWSTYAAPFYLFEDTTVSYFGLPVGGTRKSAIRDAVYRFAEGPDDLDSDEDGVPDYVELGEGLDPLAGDDTDGDGFSDRTELVFGYDPNSQASHPPTNNVLRLEEKFAFDIAQTPRPYDGTVPGFTLVHADTGTIARAYDMQGALYQVSTTAMHSISGVVDPAAHLSNVVIDTTLRLLTTATEPHFSVDTVHSNTLIGRELIGFTPVPSITSGLHVAYSYGGGNLSTEAANWIAAALAAQTNATRETVKGELDTYDTLVALLVEKKVQDILHDRGVVPPTNEVTLLPFRVASLSHYNPTKSELLALESRVGETHPGYRMESLFTSINDGVDTPADGSVSNLKALVDDVYRISSASNSASPGVYPSPVDVLRTFLHDGDLHSNYLAVTALSPGERLGATAGCSNLLAAVPPRPTTNITLVVTSNAFSKTCSTLETTDGLQLKSLFFSGGQAYNFPESFGLIPGSEVQVLAYTDRIFNGCGGDHLEVISIGLYALPEASPTDSNGNLLPDAWEYVFFGDLLGTPFADSDGDGFSDLQESFDGTDPDDPHSHSGTAADLSPPLLALEFSGATKGPAAMDGTEQPAALTEIVLR